MIIKREIFNRILNSVDSFPVTLITGPRQVGKSFLCSLLHKEKKFNYISLDVQKNLELAINDPELFLDTYQAPLIIDEIQKAPILFEYLAPIVNNKRFNQQNSNGMFVLTGSHQFNLMKNVSESLAGRVSIINVSGLSFNEIIKREEIPFKIDPKTITKRALTSFTKKDLINVIFKGSFPEMHVNKKLEWKNFYDSYVNTYISKDVIEILPLKKNSSLFLNFLENIAKNTGGEFIGTNFARELGVDLKTIVNWLGILQTSGLIKILCPWAEQNSIRTLTKRNKVYVSDTGLACYLCGLYDPKSLEKSQLSGRLIETFVINEIMKTYENSIDQSAKFFYYRDRYKNEIDLVMLTDGKINLIEIKSGITFRKKDIAAFEYFKARDYAIDKSGIICTSPSLYAIDKDRYVFPIWSI
ncbi:ATP-binding protein [[Mycoplasma] testudinis]|uniref:ATP-binding protein n=1 Tax=[Mycoplasma] testudinis TaxID=33924 RepID=UPI000698047F|nr:AAA family ATPase [[Mycoplasma] testudinis]